MCRVRLRLLRSYAEAYACYRRPARPVFAPCRGLGLHLFLRSKKKFSPGDAGKFSLPDRAEILSPQAKFSYIDN